MCVASDSPGRLSRLDLERVQVPFRVSGGLGKVLWGVPGRLLESPAWPVLSAGRPLTKPLLGHSGSWIGLSYVILSPEFQRAKTPKLGCSVRPNPKTGVLRIARSNLVPRQGVKMPP